MDATISAVHIRAMTRIGSLALAMAAAVVAFGAFGGCSKGREHTPYMDDVTKICDVMHLSGADKATTAQQTLMTAKWLGDNLTTPEAHDFLISLQKYDGVDKANALDAEAKKLGIGACALSDQWR